MLVVVVSRSVLTEVVVCKSRLTDVVVDITVSVVGNGTRVE